MEIENLKDIIQDCNINFLIGSGMSVPYFTALGNIEVLLTDLDKHPTLTTDEKKIIRASILGKYFENVISKNPEIIEDGTVDPTLIGVLNSYKDFLVSLNTILLKRKTNIVNKQVNLFTTNIDVFFEKSLELTQVQYNDGFYGRFNPIFGLTNFKNSIFKKSLHYDNTSEIPVFNLLKVHGSLTWKTSGDSVMYSDLSLIDEVKISYLKCKSKLIEFSSTDSITPHFVSEVSGISPSVDIEEFLEAYTKLAVVNPTKEKFQDTTLNLNYYELLRLFSNELEKENTVLFVMGFSVADEHIREILVRAANSNPTLVIKIFAYDLPAKAEISANLSKGGMFLRYNNIEVMEAETPMKYNFQTINEAIFNKILNDIS